MSIVLWERAKEDLERLEKMCKVVIPMRAQPTNTSPIQNRVREFTSGVVLLDDNEVIFDTVVFDGADVTIRCGESEPLTHRDDGFPVYLTLDGEEVALGFENASWVVMNDTEVLI